MANIVPMGKPTGKIHKETLQNFRHPGGRVSSIIFPLGEKMPRGHAAGKPVKFYRKIKLLPDGTKHSANEISNMFGVSQSTLSKKVKAGKKVWTREELVEWAIRIENHPLRRCRDRRNGSAPAKPVIIRNIDDVEYNPSAMERALMGVR